MEYNHPNCNDIWLDDVIKNAKTGDIILFKATDNMNSSKIFCYYTHIGVVYKPMNSNPMIFEAAGTTGMTLYDHENKSGIFLTDLHTRLSRYKGYLYHKSLNNIISEENNNNFMDFVLFAKKNMYYEYSVLWNGIKKGLGFENCGLGTNCGELTFLSLIKLGILDEKKYNSCIFHHLQWMSNIIVADNNFEYHNIKKINISPFC